MDSLSQALAELHALLSELEEVEGQLTSGPRKIAAARRVADKRLAECAEQKERIITLRKAADEKSLHLKTTETRISDLREKLNAAASNREYAIIKSQIEADSMANSVLEDEILEALDKVDHAVVDLETLETSHAKQVEKQAQITATVARDEPGLKSRVEELRAAIVVAEKCIPASAVDGYRRLVQAHGAGTLAAVDAAACGQCYSQLSPQDGVQLNLGKILFCRSCGRILYRVKPRTADE